MKRRTVSIIVTVLAVGIIGVFAVSRIQTKADTVPVMGDSVEVANDNVAEESEQAPPVTDEEPEQAEEVTPVTQEQDNTAQEEIDMVEEETDTEPIDEALTDITALDKTMYATGAVNTRSGPSMEYERVGGLTTNEEVHVIGQSNLTAWYQIDVDGVTQFVSNNYLADAKVEVPQPEQSITQSSSNITDDSTPPPLTPELEAILNQYGGTGHLNNATVTDGFGISDIDVSGITAE